MPKYRTLDQHVKYRGELLPPDTEISVIKGDVKVWDELVRLRAAVKVGRTLKEAAPPEEAVDDTDIQS